MQLASTDIDSYQTITFHETADETPASTNPSLQSRIHSQINQNFLHQKVDFEALGYPAASDENFTEGYHW